MLTRAERSSSFAPLLSRASLVTLRAMSCSLSFCVLLTCRSAAAEPSAASLELFEKSVRPLLVHRCYECHSEDAAESGLRLDSLQGLLQGGERGPAIVPGQPDASLLIGAVRHGELLKMPPRSKLSTAEIAQLERWIALGATWPGAAAQNLSASSGSSGTQAQFSPDQLSHWAFQKPQLPALPEVRNGGWVQSPIDRFILHELEQRGLSPAPPAEKSKLIRRVTFDLLGLPPSPQEVEAFLADTTPDAFTRVVDRLLASPRYGERWGRHWLDVARYADSNGLDENLAYANAYRYRDYVIAALNADRPFERFVQEQIAGDLLPRTAAPEDPLNPLVATGFLSLGAKMLAEDDPVKMQMDIIDEQVDTIGRALLGLTLGCARCHDHKYDPITAADYYALAGIFRSTRTMETYKVVARWLERPLASPEAVKARDELLAQIAAIDTQLKALSEPPTAPSTPQTGSRQAAADRTAALAELQAKKTQLEAQLPKISEVMAVRDESPQDLKIHIRGSHLTLGASVPRGIPRIFASAVTIPPEHSGRRELAQWIVHPENPLTARVLVNRLWHWHFGAGLVRTPDNFGILGERPTHPELLDWLACQCVASHGSLKELHRVMLLSSTYQMSSQGYAAAAERDPDNRLWWRQNRRRLEAEAVRDAILAVSEQLDERMGGSLLPTANRQYVTSTANVNPVVYRSNRRSVYLPVVRSALYEVFQAFDFADPNVSVGARETTTVAPQALFMMNSEFVAQQSRAMATQLLAETRVDDSERVSKIFYRCLGRLPTETERHGAIAYLANFAARAASEQPALPDPKLRAWQSLCRAVLSTNEFVYVE